MILPRCVGIFLLCSALAAWAATFTVTTTNDLIADDGLLSLREAVILSNTNSDLDTIQVPAGTYTFSIPNAGGPEDGSLTGDLDIHGPVIIAGAGATSTIINAADLDRVCYVAGDGDATFMDLSLVNGWADQNGGGLYNDGTSRLVRCHIMGNYSPQFGGGIHVFSGRLLVESSTLCANVAPNGGGIDVNNGFIVISNSTISGNYALDGGGLFRDLGTVTIYHSTLASNRALSTGGGILTSGGAGNVTLAHTLVASNTAPSSPDVYGAFGTLGHNLIGNDQGSLGFIPSDVLNVSPRLGVLAFNGGPTLTHALPNGSPAVNAGDPAYANAAEFDQRGPGFLRRRGIRVDIGAYEFQTPDDDEDGVLDEEEMLADTDPTNSTSYFRIEAVTCTQETKYVEFASSTNRVYWLEGADAPAGPDWHPLTGSVTGGYSRTTLSDDSNRLFHAYRVMVGLP
jgi:hypothetical protein